MCEEACQDLLKYCLSFGGSLELKMIEIEKECGGNRRKRFYNEMWGNLI